ncbi:hypothetical protein O6P43_012579 [Quillaja saponaria]|uniref:Uncharacterized protein n=1 Tax=Quillaja saponaria TaxID=32244 RepID=A0AAD7M207_QUISA|nr:hypothetical protein O6P43_012579 [Quillaja saponaria]
MLSKMCDTAGSGDILDALKELGADAIKSVSMYLGVLKVALVKTEAGGKGMCDSSSSNLKFKCEWESLLLLHPCGRHGCYSGSYWSILFINTLKALMLMEGLFLPA